MKRALIVGGTKGIGLALACALDKRGWYVDATGTTDFDIGWPVTWNKWHKKQYGLFDLVVFSAGYLKPQPWKAKRWPEYMKSYSVNVLGPVYFLGSYADLLKDSADVVFISSVGAVNDGGVDLAYSTSKAALERAAKTIAKETSWKVHVIRFDLVDTDMMKLLPEVDDGREIMSPKQAALKILEML